MICITGVPCIKAEPFSLPSNQANRRQRLLTEHIGLLRDIFRRVKRRYPFHIDAIVILPDHLHTIWTLPEGDSEYAKRWHLIKSRFSRRLPATELISESRKRKGERGIWQRRYWEHRIRDESDYLNHLNYIHYNPVKHGHVKQVVDWPYSSFHRYVRAGLLPVDWGCDKAANGSHDYGE